MTLAQWGQLLGTLTIGQAKAIGVRFHLRLEVKNGSS